MDIRIPPERNNTATPLTLIRLAKATSLTYKKYSHQIRTFLVYKFLLATRYQQPSE